ncbi:MAG: sirohydrochlorin chelatase [bacterium]
MNKESIILLGHGSRRDDANNILKTIAKLIQPKFPEEKIEFAFLELAEPNIKNVIEKCIHEEHSKKIYVMPYFLYSGNHVSRDIPDILNEFSIKYPDVNIKYGNYLGIDEKLTGLVTERIETLKYEKQH